MSAELLRVTRWILLAMAVPAAWAQNGSTAPASAPTGASGASASSSGLPASAAVKPGVTVSVSASPASSGIARDVAGKTRPTARQAARGYQLSGKSFTVFAPLGTCLLLSLLLSLVVWAIRH